MNIIFCYFSTIKLIKKNRSKESSPNNSKPLKSATLERTNARRRNVIKANKAIPKMLISHNLQVELLSIFKPPNFGVSGATGSLFSRDKELKRRDRYKVGPEIFFEGDSRCGS